MVSDPEGVRRYFSERASQWLATAYGAGDHSSSYPLGRQRVELAIEAILGRLGGAWGHLVDLGCGGGDLCLQAARLGYRVTGIDVAQGMVEVAEARRQTLPPEIRERLTFLMTDALESGLRDGCADAIIALGLLEYLNEDTRFFRESARLLRPGGVLVVSCRNRLFNMASLNEYTRREVEVGTATALLAELVTYRPDGETRRLLGEFLARLRAALPDLEEALALDLQEPLPGRRATQLVNVGAERRQHTPSELAAAATSAGFASPTFVGIHPHPFLPVLEAIAPRFYNRLVCVFEALERARVSLSWSSAFLGVFTR